MMQENNNFNTIISTWRRMSAEQGESVTVSMSGDSPDYQLNKKKDEESNLLVPEKIKGPIATAASAGAVGIVAEAPQNELANSLEEKLLCREKESTKEAAGDGNINPEEDTDYLENKDEKTPEKKYPEEKEGLKTPEKKKESVDKVDSAIIQPGSKPPQSLSNSDDKEKEDCFLVCLYYTLECCDCVLM